MTTEQTRPPLDAQPLVIFSHCFGLPADQIQAHIEEIGEVRPSPEDGDFWDHHDPLAEGVSIAQAMGLPHDPQQHQQPHDAARVLTKLLPIRSAESDDVIETYVNRVLYPLASDQFKTLLQTLPREQAFSRIRWIACELSFYFGSSKRVTREARMRAFLKLVEWFQDTEGLHDSDSGVVDVETAALRKYIAIYGGKK